MTPIQYSTFHTLIQELAASAPGSWLLGRVLRYLDQVTIRASGGRVSLTGLLAGVPVVMVTTTGARSGLPRRTPLLPIRDPAGPERFALIASNWGQHRYPAWYFNLKKNPRAACAMNSQADIFIAHEAAGDEYDRFWDCAMDTYFGYASYKRRAGRRIPIMVMEREN